MKNLSLKFTPGYIYTENPDTEVIGYWEKPLMAEQAKLCCHNNGHILEIGFGLGLFAEAAHSIGIKSHTIVEIHPEILKNLKAWAKNKDNVKIIEGDWFEKINSINQYNYDGIFFDTHLDRNRSKFRQLIVDHTLNQGGIFTYFDMKDEDSFEYGDKLQTFHVHVESPVESRLGKCIEDFKVNFFKNISTKCNESK